MNSVILTGRFTTNKRARLHASFGPPKDETPSSCACQSDLGIRGGRRAVSRTAIYLCNQHIYAPNRRLKADPRWDLITHEHPLRCVIFDDVHLEHPAARAWLASMEAKYHLRRRIDLIVPTIDLDDSKSHDSVYIYEFEPRHTGSTEPVAVGTPTRLAR